jgi:hypothetical protein
MSTINFAARFEYLSAIETHWPEVLGSLRKKVFPVYLRCLESRGERLSVEKLRNLLNAPKRNRLPEMQPLAHAVRGWAKHFEFRDTWFRDVALQTMHGWDEGGAVSKWTYLPEELRPFQFQVNFGYWSPHLTSWTDYSRFADQKFSREKAAYRAAARKTWGEGSPSLSQHAVWTVLYQRDKSPAAIQRQHRKTTGRKVSTANILKCVHEFAAAAGLTLRGSKTRPPKNTTAG